MAALERPLAAAFIDGGGRNGLGQRCLGVKLGRFSLWHLFMLRAINSPLVNLGDVELHHLQDAAGICRLRFPDSRLTQGAQRGEAATKSGLPSLNAEARRFVRGTRREFFQIPITGKRHKISRLSGLVHWRKSSRGCAILRDRK